MWHQKDIFINTVILIFSGITWPYSIYLTAQTEKTNSQLIYWTFVCVWVRVWEREAKSEVLFTLEYQSWKPVVGWIKRVVWNYVGYRSISLFSDLGSWDKSDIWCGCPLRKERQTILHYCSNWDRGWPCLSIIVVYSIVVIHCWSALELVTVFVF